MTIIENLGSNHDIIRYVNLGDEEKLVYSKDGSDKIITIFKGENLNKLVEETSEVESLMNSKRATREYLGNSDNGLFHVNRILNESTGLYDYEVESTNGVKLEFLSPQGDIDHQTLEDLSLCITSFYNSYERYIEFFKKITKNEGFLLKTDSEPEWMLTKLGSGYELFIPKDDENDYCFRAYFSEHLDNYSIDLSSKSYGVESDSDFGLHDFYDIIPNEALIELELEDKRVIQFDLFDGVDLDNGIVVRDKNISSQRLIKNIRIYYEINKSPQY